jgi:hypothetical protein
VNLPPRRKMGRMTLAHWRSFYLRHYGFLLLLLLFVSFRLLAIALLRPGGFIANYSEIEYYYAWGLTGPMGYATFENLWSVYPPLFPALMLPVFELASRIPAWSEPRLVFHTLFTLELLLFEIGNLVLLYRLAGKLATELPHCAAAVDADAPDAAWQTLRRSPLLPPLLYALLFAPAYTMLGWFDAMPLFFLLLGLDLLLSRWRGAWAGSAVAVGLGFLVKLTPVILLPIAVRWLGARLSWDALRHEWFVRRSPGNLLRPAAYTAIFVAVVVGAGFPLARFNLELALSSFRANSIRPPWQSLWALLDGYDSFGLVPIDMRNLAAFRAGGQWESHLPWGLITAAFLLAYLWLYTRRYDWTQRRTAITFTAVSMVWLLLYLKGWSPQFVVWVIAFLVLLSPTIRGMALAIGLTAINFVESYVYMVILPAERWILVATVITRTLLLLLLGMEWLGTIWPAPRTARLLQQAGAWGGTVVLAAAVIGAVVATPSAAAAYSQRRLAEHPCRPAIEQLQARSGDTTTVLATPQETVWRDFYPWLHSGYTLRILEGYNPHDRPADDVIAEKMAALGAEGEFWWVEQGNSGWSPAAQQFLAQPGATLFDEQVLGACRIARMALLPTAPVATVLAAGGEIALWAVDQRLDDATGTLALTLYWSTAAPVKGNYTVFTQLFDPSGAMIAQQDNAPVNGAAPTDAWQPGARVRDPYRLTLPPNAPPGPYTLHIGMYDAQGRQTMLLADGAQADHLALPISENP